MDDELYRLVYYSRNRLSLHEREPTAAIAEILAVSRTNNAAAGVTGALLFNAGCFGQVLEGGRRAVEATFERIQRDPRHDDVSLLDFQQVAARGFATWSMAFIGADRMGAEKFGAIAGESGFDPSRMSGDYLYEALKRLTREEERQA